MRANQDRTALAAVWPPTGAVARLAGHSVITPMQAIRRKCMDCCGQQQIEVKLCEAIACPLWPFRAGRHPYTSRGLQQAGADKRASGGSLVPRTGPLSPGGLHEAYSGQSGHVGREGDSCEAGAARNCPIEVP